MSVITMETRRESNEKTDEVRPILYTRILAILSTGLSLTANEIAKRINKNWKRQDVQPRLNELRDNYKLIIEDEKKYDATTKRYVTTYKLIDKGEIWKEIEGFEGLYKVSNKGKVKRIRFINKNSNKYQERIKIPKLRKDGYFEVTLYKGGKAKYVQVHRLVASAFIENTYNKPVVNHKNGIKTDNRVENLEWVTTSENSLHSSRVLQKNVRKINQYDLKGIYMATYSSIAIASEITGIRASSISNVLAKRKKRTGKYKWEYATKGIEERYSNHIPRI